MHDQFDREGVYQSTLEQLLSHYGPLMTLEDVGRVLHRSPKALRVIFNSTLRRDRLCWQRLLIGKVRLGRHIYFHCQAVAATIAYGDDPVASD